MSTAICTRLSKLIHRNKVLGVTEWKCTHSELCYCCYGDHTLTPGWPWKGTDLDSIIHISLLLLNLKKKWLSLGQFEMNWQAEQWLKLRYELLWIWFPVTSLVLWEFSGQWWVKEALGLSTESVALVLKSVQQIMKAFSFLGKEQSSPVAYLLTHKALLSCYCIFYRITGATHNRTS